MAKIRSKFRLIPYIALAVSVFSLAFAFYVKGVSDRHLKEAKANITQTNQGKPTSSKSDWIPYYYNSQTAQASRPLQDVKFNPGDTLVALDIQLVNGYEHRNGYICTLRNAPVGGFAFDVNPSIPILRDPSADVADFFPDCDFTPMPSARNLNSDYDVVIEGRGVKPFSAGTPFIYGVIYLNDGTSLGEPNGCYLESPTVGGVVHAMSTAENDDWVLASSKAADYEKQRLGSIKPC